jgi:DNA-binding beta-propeller fold protein YncE
VILVFALLAGRRAGATARGLMRATLGGALLLTAASLLFLPSWALLSRGSAGIWGREAQQAPVAGVLTVFGVFFVAVVPPLLGAALRDARRARAVAGMAAGIVLAAGIATLRSPAAAIFGALVVLGLAAWGRSAERGVQAAALLTALAGAIGVTTECVYVWDRMNTVFKYYLDAWLLLGCAAGALVASGAPARAAWRRPWLSAVGLAALGGAVTSVTAAVAFIRSPQASSDVPTLDGMAYLRRLRPAELQAYEWLNREVAGTPVLLEAQGPSYQEFTRVAMNTGLPTPLGWEYHLVQQGRSADRIARRRADIRELYTTTDWRRAAALLARYRIDLVFVGPLERRTYPAAGLRKFEQWTSTRPVFRNGEVTIYAVPGLLAQAKTWVEPIDDAAVAAPLGVLREPRGVARTPDGGFVVADFGHDRLQRFAADRTAEEVIGEAGSGPGEFNDPCGVDVGPDGRLYVADTWNHRIQVLSPAGEALAEWRADMYGPRGVVLAPDGSLYVTDTGNRRVVHFGAAGEVRGVWGQDVLAAPVGIAIAHDGDLLVADPPRQRIVVFSPQGAVRAEWPVAWRDGARLEPYLDVGPEGVVWVSDPTGDQVLLFDAAGNALGAAVPESTLHLPLGIAVVDARSAVAISADDGALVVVRRAD